MVLDIVERFGVDKYMFISSNVDGWVGMGGFVGVLTRTRPRKIGLERFYTKDETTDGLRNDFSTGVEM